MRILFCGDTHGGTAHVKYLIETALEQSCDRIFVLGDFGYWEHQREGVEFLDQVSAFAIKKKISVYFLDGNHDKTSLLLAKHDDQNAEGFLTVRGRLFYAHRGHQWAWGGVQFIALGGAYSVDKDYRLRLERKGQMRPGSLWFPEEEMSDADMVKILKWANPRKVDVMLAHDKPRWSEPRWNRKSFDECLPNQLRLQRAIDALRPELYLHGHLHVRYEDVMDLVSKNGDRYLVRVIGLDCDPQAAETKGYRVEDSWYVFDTEEFVDMREMHQALADLALEELAAKGQEEAA